jgi:predicted DNA binding protein
MWIASITYDGSKSPVGTIAKRFKVSITMYPVSVYEEKNKFMIFYACNIYGNETNVNEAIKYAKKVSQMHYLERNKNFLLVLFEEPKLTMPLFMHNIIHYKPIEISDDGEETWSPASITKNSLMDYIKVLQDTRKAKLKFIKQIKLGDISVAQMHPELTLKQMNAVKFAIEEGYYTLPRKTNIQTLAKKMKLAFSTFQNHIRKAESKLIPFSFGKIK